MALIRRRFEPARELAEWLPRWFYEWPEFPPFAGLTEEMKVEEFKENGTVVVKAELPGMDPDKDVEITVSDDTLRIHAERREEKKEEKKEYYRSEFRYGSFTRTLPLPAGASDEDVKATYHDGILEVRVPIVEEAAEAKKIPVSRG